MVISAKFEIKYLQFLNPDGEVVTKLPTFASDAKKLIPLYEGMVLTRTYDAKAVALQRTGRLGTFASSLGQEAVSVGLASAMKSDDVLVPSFREQGAYIWRGVGMAQMLQYWGGDEFGNQLAPDIEDCPPSIPIGTQGTHGTGIAHAIKLRGEKRAVVCVFGDGATSKGEIYEAMNLAGAWKLPIVFVINNNQWAISVPRDAQSATETLAQKGIGAGIPSLQVDGNDVIAVKYAVEEALNRARKGEGASVIEAVTYRMTDHTTADDATRYREEKEVSAQWKQDPITRLRTYLGNEGAWTKKDEERLTSETRQKVEEAAESYLALPDPDPSSMFDYLYETLPDAYVSQRDDLLGRSKK
ncbi:MAG: pyruvate dehydrogenase (acetyl-transferring) E1 component subunit alpha [Alphaproteobacteria bacterium]|nr:pyruvate dehydrogenase (acetyl-transferring) E1 component subunit alpha [Alphaproteobacteria bacterium]MBT5389859.1 pyruvate dehydrogenase (acetyl-transferring) E1 component subunit alpha [Alphaproteobacteria bacterium]MBT5540063.1 pyruvate dehydrogenase (acetyl-transferring) E1 component subunit alpha [Alphaproteobacteria bacterium]MBT5655096.1 pyruvate dehydrogenase (acetyl-transferring) E1 component subunit alpha [Alphaproteobacteria bacterium]